MANALLTPSVIAEEALMQLENNLVMGNLVHRDYEDEFVKVGDTISIRKPVKVAATAGATLGSQDIEEGKTTVTIDQRQHVPMSFLTQDMTLTIEDFSKRYIQPAMMELAQVVESSLMGLYSSVWNFRGTPGTTPANFSAVAAGAQLLDETAVPTSPRAAVFNPAATYALANDMKDKYVESKAKTAMEMAKIGKFATFDSYSAQSVKLHNAGGGGSPLINGAVTASTWAAVKDTNVSTIVTDGWTNSIVIKAGDVITIAGVYSLNPKTRVSTGQLQNFVVTAQVTASGAGAATLVVSPAIITAGPYATVDAAPADNAVITVKTGTNGTLYAQNLLFNPNAFALVMRPLYMPNGANFKAQKSYKGLSIRMIQDYSISTDYETTRFDILYGVKAIYPELACRLTG